MAALRGGPQQGRRFDRTSRESDIVAAELERVVTRRAPLLLRALPHHARKTVERHQRLAGIGPLLKLLDCDVIERLTPGAAREQRARNIDHMRRARPLVKQRRAALRAEAARSFRARVLVARDRGLTTGDA